MKEINREQAEMLFKRFNAVKTQVMRQQHELQLYVKLSDQKTLIVKYDNHSGKKSFFLN